MVNARDEATWEKRLKDLFETMDGQAAVACLNGIDKTKWASKFFPGRRYGHHTSNIAEQLNNTLRLDWELSTIELLYAIWNRYMALHSTRLQG
jgi:hypothetical protein